jgi:hypothetical protein
MAGNRKKNKVKHKNWHDAYCLPFFFLFDRYKIKLRGPRDVQKITGRLERRAASYSHRGGTGRCQDSSWNKERKKEGGGAKAGVNRAILGIFNIEASNQWSKNMQQAEDEEEPGVNLCKRRYKDMHGWSHDRQSSREQPSTQEQDQRE